MDTEFAKLYFDAKLWHGTGRYKYDNGLVVDALQQMVSAGGIVPHMDVWDQKRGPSLTVSLARVRPYARLYASLFFPPNQRSLCELWKRLVWCCTYFLSSKWVAWQEYPPPRPHIPDQQRKLRTWVTKFSTRPQSSFAYLFLWGGTDVRENYPVLIGVRGNSVQPTTGSRFVDLHEVRTSAPVPINDFTHIEVPQSYVAATTALFVQAGYCVPVIALERGDAFKPR